MRRLLLFLVLASPCFGSVAFDAVGSGSTAAAGTSIPNFTLTIGGGVTNGAVAVGVAWSSAAITLPSVTVGGSAATLVANTNSTGSTYRTSIYCLATGSSTGAKTVSISWTGSSSGAAGAVSFSGVNQTTPCKNGTAAFSGGTGPTSVAITSVSGDMTLDTAGCESGATPTAPTKTSRVALTSADFQIGLGMSTAAGASSNTHQWTTGSGWEASGVDIQAAASTVGPNVGFKGKVGFVGKVGIL